PGVCIRLYSEEDFQSRPEFTEPEIKRTNLASVILQMQSLGLGALEDFDFIEPPDHRLVNDGRKLLVELGAMSDKNPPKVTVEKQSIAPSSVGKGGVQGGLTKIGQQMAKMPIDPRLARMILGGAHFGVLNEVLVIVAA
ncbi:MAG: ATP-dependent helicase, partial [Acinetobacter sp.]